MTQKEKYIVERIEIVSNEFTQLKLDATVNAADKRLLEEDELMKQHFPISE